MKLLIQKKHCCCGIGENLEQIIKNVVYLMELDLKDKVVLIAGSSRGIGKTISYSFAKEGSVIVVTGRDKTSLDNTVAELKNEYGNDKILGFCCDLGITETIKSILSKIISITGKIDIIVANIGSGRGKPGYDVSDSEWDRLLNINLLASMKIAREAVPHLKRNNVGSIIFISSIAGLETLGAPLAYEAAKSAVIASVKNLSYKLAQYNIRVNSVAPGNIFFPGSTWDVKLKDNPEVTKEYINLNVPLRRLGTPEEVANAVLFLASNRASFITGACIVVDGGQTKGN